MTPVTPAPLPQAGEIARLDVFPAKVVLKGLDDAAQLVVTAVLKNGQEVDVTGNCQYSGNLASTIKVTPLGRAIPVANGTGSLSIFFAGAQTAVPVESTCCDQILPINFPNQIVPIFTKLSCNGGGCHGKASGQNGFKLGLLGFDPELDFNTLVKEGRGRRIMTDSPDASLLLTKATGTVAHGGGRKMEPASDEYKLVRRWIASGSPYGKPTDPVLKSVSVHPSRRVMSRQSRQQFAVLAHYSDGSSEDITRRAQYESNDTEIATVDAVGLVRSQNLSG
ncbi:MAG: S-layer protein, partial [Planctomycetota bacterium]